MHHKKGMFKCYDRYLEIASRLCTDFVAKDKFDKSRTSRNEDAGRDCHLFCGLVGPVLV